MTTSELAERALEFSPAVKSVQSRVDQAEYELDYVSRQNYARITTYVRTGFGDGVLESNQLDDQFGVQLTKTLIDFGRNSADKESSKARVLASRASTESMRRRLYEQTLIDILEARLADQNRQLYENRVKSLEERVELAEEQLKDGSTTINIVTRFRSELAQARLQQVQSRSRRDVSLTRIAQFSDTDIPPCLDQVSLRVLLAPAIALTSEEIIERMDNDPTIIEARELLNGAGADVKRAAREWRPSVRATGFVSQTYNSITDNLIERDRLGIEVTVPLYDGRQTQSRVGRFRAREDELRWSLEQTLLERRTELLTNYDRRNALEEALAAARDAEGSASDYLEATGKAFEFGAATVDDLLQAEAQLLQLKSSRLTSEAQYDAALAKLIFPLSIPVEDWAFVPDHDDGFLPLGPFKPNRDRGDVSEFTVPDVDPLSLPDFWKPVATGIVKRLGGGGRVVEQPAPEPSSEAEPEPAPEETD